MLVPMLLGDSQFVAMRARHEIWKKKYPTGLTGQRREVYRPFGVLLRPSRSGTDRRSVLPKACAVVQEDQELRPAA